MPLRQNMSKIEAEELLELPGRYTAAELRRAYAHQLQEYHPDVAARNGHSEEEAAARTSDVNVAYSVLKDLFDGDREVITRGLWESTPGGSGIESGFGGVDWRSGTDGPDFWDFAQDDAPVEKVPVNPRTVLLGPVIPRVVLVALFGWVWWRTFPLVPGGPGAPSLGADLSEWARFSRLAVYPTYLLIYEAVTGNVSALLREWVNDLVSWATRRYYDLRPRGSSYGCPLHRIVTGQMWSVLMFPIVVTLVDMVLSMPEWNAVRTVTALVGALLAVDMLAATVRGGLVNAWTTALGERVEASYLNSHARLMRRCGKWQGTSE